MSEDKKPEQFMLRFRGVKAPVIWTALSILTPALDWRKTPKGRIAKYWAQQETATFSKLSSLTLDEIDAIVKRILNGESTWSIMKRVRTAERKN